MDNPTTHGQDARGGSPWSFSLRVKMQLWWWAWPLLCAWTPKPFTAWRRAVLRLFGAKLCGRPFIHQRARIQLPWNLTMREGSSLGDRTNVYTLGPVEIGRDAVVAQEAYLCTGTHEFGDEKMNLVTAPIVIGDGAFIGVRALILPGVTVGEGAIVGAGAVVARDVAPRSVVAGNPAREIGKRKGNE
jgi:putative colanic acid biosynthesis acetyltransferase WcaF